MSSIERRHERDGPPARVLLVDKHPLFRDGLRACLTKAGGFAICGETDDPARAKRMAASSQPDVAIVGVDAPEPTLLNLIEGLCHRPQAPKIVALLGIEGLPGPTASLFRRGASAVLSKQVDGEELVQAIRNVLKGRAYLSAETIEQLVRRRSRTAGGAE